MRLSGRVGSATQRRFRSPRSRTTRLPASSDLLASASLPASVEAALVQRADGNPLYAEEFVRMLDDRGLLVGRGDGEELAAEDVPVPESLHGVIAARLDTLPYERKLLIQAACVVGKVFWAGALAAVSGVSKEAVLTGLHELARKELVRRVRVSSIADDVEYMFWHVLVRDVAYAQIPRSQRAASHIAAARWIERVAGERVDDHAEFLSHHYRVALDLARASGDPSVEAHLAAAVRFGVLAAERAARLDNARGERLYRETLALLPPDDPSRPRLLAEAAHAGTTAGTSFDQVGRDLEIAIAGLQAQGISSAPRTPCASSVSPSGESPRA